MWDYHKFIGLSSQLFIWTAKDRAGPLFFSALSHIAYVAQFFTFMYNDSPMLLFWLYFQTQIPDNAGYYLLVAFILLFYVSFLLLLVGRKFFYLCILSRAPDQPQRYHKYLANLVFSVCKL